MSWARVDLVRRESLDGPAGRTFGHPTTIMQATPAVARCWKPAGRGIHGSDSLRGESQVLN